MRRRLLLACSALTLAAAGPVFADDAPRLAAGDRAAIESVIHDYLIAHPEVIMEAVQGLRQREEAAEAEAQRTALTTRKDELYNNPQSPVIGNPQGDVTLVEFTDYQCGYCKAVFADVDKLVSQDGRIRLVLKEFPILGPASVTAAKVALAARGQNKYTEVRNALMAHRGQLDEDTILRLAKGAGADAERLKRDMDAPEITAAIEANLKLADALNIHGTPAFAVGDRVVPGAVDLKSLKALVASARKES